MYNPLEVTWKGIPQNSRIDDLIQEKFDKIHQPGIDIVKCHVIFEKLSKHHQKGNAYCVRLDLKLAHFTDIVITDESKEGDLPLAALVRSVFKKAHEAVKKQIGRRKKPAIRPDFQDTKEEDDV